MRARCLLVQRLLPRVLHGIEGLPGPPLVRWTARPSWEGPLPVLERPKSVGEDRRS